MATTTSLAPDPFLVASRPTVLDVVVPVHNEEHDLERSVRRLHDYLVAHFPYTFRITIADNASTDATLDIARKLSDELPEVTVVRLEQKGRGRALHHVWLASEAHVLSYMDVDLSTDLAALLPLVAPLVSGHSDLAIGTRLARSSRVARGPKREVISRCYNLILRTALSAKFSDAQCGFKAIRADRARQLLPLVEDTGWFFDTELLVLAERVGLRIHEVPVDWVDDPDSRVDIVATAVEDLKGIVRIGRALGSGRLPLAALRDRAAVEPAVPAAGSLIQQLLRFAVVGVFCTAAYVLMYVLLRDVMPALWANATALLATAVVNTALNRRVTFGVRGPAGQLRHQARGLAVFGLGLGLATGSLLLLGQLDPGASPWVELSVLVTANVFATVLRFLLFRAWVFPRLSATTAKA